MSSSVPFLFYPCKRAADCNELAKSFKKFIATTYKKELAEELSGPCEELQTLRGRCIAKYAEPHENTLELFSRFDFNDSCFILIVSFIF